MSEYTHQKFNKKNEVGDEKDFLEKLTKFVNSPDLLKEYWNNHPNLTTMEKHINELSIIYRRES